MLLSETTGSNNEQENDKGNFFKLIHVGNLSYESESRSHVFFCSFQPWLLPQDCPSNSPIVTRTIGIKLAGKLICGSIWVDSSKFRKPKYKNNFETQVFELGTNEISAILLKDVINPAMFVPKSFWLAKGDTWVICIELYDKNIIIPYFELLRVLFYQASSRLTKFFFSFLPLGSLCRPIIVPKEENSRHGAFYVASMNLSASEARIIGGLLFDKAIKNIFDLSQTHWLFPNSIDTLSAKSDRIKKSVGKPDVRILFNATGHNFSYENNKYFWVDSLEVISSPYSFNEILFHPLQSPTLHSSNISTLSLCSDILGINNNFTKTLKLYKLIDYTIKSPIIKNMPNSTASSIIAHAKLSSLPFPYVICGLPWAAAPAEKQKFYWLDKVLEKEITYADKKSINKRVALTSHLSHILVTFEKHNYPIEYLTLNNPNNIFGERISVFPTKSQLPSLIYFGIDNIAICTVVSIELTHGKIFLIQPYPENNPDLIILCQKQDLSVPNELEWNKLFNIIIPIHDSTDFYEFFKLVRKANIHNTSTNSALLAVALPSKIVTKELCISFSNHVFSRFIKRLQFYVSSTLKYPAGMSREQKRKVVLLSRSMCKAPDSLWITKFFTYWPQQIHK